MNLLELRQHHTLTHPKTSIGFHTKSYFYQEQSMRRVYSHN
nr:MAG TPA: hypothetical protein [Caudoviricetes sp.]